MINHLLTPTQKLGGSPKTFSDPNEKKNVGNSLWNFLENQESQIENWRELSSKLKLENVVVCPIGNMYFSRYLAQELCLETLNAYHDIRSFLDYSNTTITPEQEIKEKAKKLGQYYFDFDSPFERK